MNPPPVISTVPQPDQQPFGSSSNGKQPSFSNQSKFESLEPSRYPDDEPPYSKNTRSTPKDQMNIYDKSEVTHNRRNKDIHEL